MINIDTRKEDIHYNIEKHPKFEVSIEPYITRQNTLYQLRRGKIRENKSNICPTLVALMETGGRNVPLIKDNFGIRRLTVEECLLLQGFSEDYFPEYIKIKGKKVSLSNSEKYKQIGNAVTIDVVERIAFNIINAL